MIRAGLTLLELVIILMILIVVSAIVVPLLSGESTHKASAQATIATLRTLRESIVGTASGFGFYPDVRRLPSLAPGVPVSLDLNELVIQGTYLDFNPSTQQGWRGPYLLGDTFTALRPLPLDGWGNSIRLDPKSVNAPFTRTTAPDAQLISAGPDGVPSSDDVTLNLWQ